MNGLYRDHIDDNRYIAAWHTTFWLDSKYICILRCPSETILKLPNKGIASLVAGIVSARTCENTVRDSRIVTPERTYHSTLKTNHVGFYLYFTETQFMGLIYLVPASLPNFHHDQLHDLLPFRLARISTEDNMLTTLIQKRRKANDNHVSGICSYKWL